MKRPITYKLAFLLSLFLFSGSLFACSSKLNTEAINNNSNLPISDASDNSSFNSDTSTPSSSNETPSENSNVTAPTNQPTQTIQEPEVTLGVKDKTISLGDSLELLLDTFGTPNRVLDTEYDFDYYVYNNDYSKLVFFAVKENHIVGFYTDSIDFQFQGISSGDSISTVNKSLGENFSVSEVVTHKTDHYTLKVMMDKLETQKVTGIYLLDDSVKKEKFTEDINKNIELMVYDLTNSIRVRNGEAVLSWSSSAAIAARNHSKNMAAHDFFNHINPAGQSPSDRLQSEGLAFSTNGENIIAGYGTAILSVNGWYNSSGHRSNLLNPNYRYLGVGFTYDSKSKYKTYITQNFYR